MSSITITLELPPKHLSPNSPGGTRWKSAYVKKYREHAIQEMQIALKKQSIDVDELPWSRVISQETFYWPTRRRRDVRNAEAMLKAAYDGFVRGGLLVDDDIEHLTHEPTKFAYSKHDPRVEIKIRVRQ